MHVVLPLSLLLHSLFVPPLLHTADVGVLVDGGASVRMGGVVELRGVDDGVVIRTSSSLVVRGSLLLQTWGRGVFAEDGSAVTLRAPHLSEGGGGSPPSLHVQREGTWSSSDCAGANVPVALAATDASSIVFFGGDVVVEGVFQHAVDAGASSLVRFAAAAAFTASGVCHVVRATANRGGSVSLGGANMFEDVVTGVEDPVDAYPPTPVDVSANTTEMVSEAVSFSDGGVIGGDLTVTGKFFANGGMKLSATSTTATAFMADFANQWATVCEADYHPCSLMEASSRLALGGMPHTNSGWLFGGNAGSASSITQQSYLNGNDASTPSHACSSGYHWKLGVVSLSLFPSCSPTVL
jgi:hypothetical protein